MTGIKRVQTRDNRQVAFDRGRIVAAILEAMASAGTGERELAEELADAVQHFLEQHHGSSSVVQVESIHDMVEKLLMETGHREIARAYILLREKRVRARERITVRHDDTRGTFDHDEELIVEGRHGALGSPWDRRRIARALIEEADFDAGTADDVAAAVEGRVFRSGLHTISTALVRELVDNELFERGFTITLRRQSSLAVPKYDLEQILFRGGDRARGVYPGDPRHVSQLVGDLILGQYILDDVYGHEVRNAHLSGAIHLHHLDRSLQVLKVALFADSQPSPAPDDDNPPDVGRFFRALFHNVGTLLSSVAEEIEVFRLAEGLHRERQRRFHLLRDMYSAASDPAVCAGELLRALEEFQGLRDGTTGPVPQVVLRIPFMPRFVEGAGGDLFAATALREDAALFLVETLRHALTDAEGPRILASCPLELEVSARTFADRRYSTALRNVLALLPEEASVRFTVEEAGAREASPLLVAGKVTLNLPRIALELGVRDPTACDPDDTGHLDEADTGHFEEAELLARQVGIALEAIRVRAAFLDRVALHPDGPFASLHRGLSAGHCEPAEHHYGIGILGLDDAVQIRTGSAMHESDEALSCARAWVRSIAESISEARTAKDPPVFMEETPNRGPLRRLQALDRDTFPEVHNTSREQLPYASGVRLGRHAPVDPLERWRLGETFQPPVKLLDRLDDIARLRSEGVEVLLAFLEEITSSRATAGAPARRADATSSAAPKSGEGDPRRESDR